jgi:hypothetical protein
MDQKQMNKEYSNVYSYSSIIMLASIGLLLKLIGSYFVGYVWQEILLGIVKWYISLRLALLLNKNLGLLFYLSRRVYKRYELLMYSILIVPLVMSIMMFFYGFLNWYTVEILEWIWFLFVILSINDLFGIFNNVGIIKEHIIEADVRKQNAEEDDPSQNISKEGNDSHNSIEENEKYKDLGSGNRRNANAPIGRVLELLRVRIDSLNRSVSKTFVAIFCTIAIGGLVALGPVFMDDYKILNELNDFRREIKAEVANISDKVDSQELLLAEKKEKISAPYREDYRKEALVQNENLMNKMAIKKSLDRLRDKLGSEGDFEKLSRTLESSSKNALTWKYITLRISIALFTLLVVQILFMIYKYNKQMTVLLTTKEEILELYNHEEAKIDELRSKLIDKLEGNPKFGRNAGFTVDQFMSLYSKNK